MPEERDFQITLADGVRMRVRFRQDRNDINEFVVQLEMQRHGEWSPVVRYDNAHGRPHLDLIDRWGRERRKIWLTGKNNEVLTEAMNDIRLHWESHLSRFEEDWQ
jgi:hypothetical protein